jgi:hypothetical protein
MSTQVQTRRGNTAQTATFTGSIAELTVDTDKKVVVVHDGVTAGGIPLSKESTASTIFNHANGAFDKANTANVLAQNAYNFANTISSGPAFAHANAAFDKANSANIIADSAYAFANSVNIKVDSAFSFANTVNIKTDAAFAFANTVNIKTDAAFAFANTVNIKTDAAFAFANTVNIKTDAAFAFSNTVNIKVDSAFTQANSANVLAQAAFDKANSVAQQGFVTVSANGTNVVADANNDTLTLSAADGVGITSNATTDTITINLTPTGVTSGTYANATHVPVFVVNAQGRLSSVTNTLIQIDASQTTTGRMNLAQGGTNAVSYTTGAFLTSNGNAFVSVANTGTAGTYANASHVPVITTDAYGRVSAVTNTAIAISTDAITSGTLAVARGGTGVTSSTGTGSVVLNTSPILTTPNIGVPSFATLTNATGLPIVAGTTGTLTIARGGTNQTTFTTGQRILFDGTSLASQANVTTTVTGGLAAANTITALTTNSYGDITAFTGAAIAIDTAQITSGTLAVARGGTGNTSLAVGSILIGSGTNAITTLANTGTAGTYGNSTHIPVVTTDAYGRVSSVTNTAISVSGSGYLANSVIVANSTGYLSNTSNLLYYSSNNTLAISGNVTIKSANTSISNSATFVFNSTLNSLDTVFI